MFSEKTVSSSNLLSSAAKAVTAKGSLAFSMDSIQRSSSAHPPRAIIMASCGPADFSLPGNAMSGAHKQMQRLAGLARSFLNGRNLTSSKSEERLSSRERPSKNRSSMESGAKSAHLHWSAVSAIFAIRSISAFENETLKSPRIISGTVELSMQCSRTPANFSSMSSIWAENTFSPISFPMARAQSIRHCHEAFLDAKKGCI